MGYLKTILKYKALLIWCTVAIRIWCTVAISARTRENYAQNYQRYKMADQAN